jgi:hypothetical protein
MSFLFHFLSDTRRFIQPLDLVTRAKTLSKRLQSRRLIWVAGASLLQAASAFVPWLSWLLWPLLVWGVVQGKSAQTVWRRPGLLYTLFLYGVLNFLIFTALSESSRLLPSVAVWIPGPEGSLFPYTFSEATAFLVTAACAERLSNTGDDVLKVLAFSVRDLLTSPISWLLFVLVYCFPFTGLASQLGMQSAQPAVSTLVGHGLLAFWTMLWALGADHATVTNHS